MKIRPLLRLTKHNFPNLALNMILRGIQISKPKKKRHSCLIRLYLIFINLYLIYITTVVIATSPLAILRNYRYF